MDKKSWIVIGIVGTIGLGVGTYFLFFKQSKGADKYGNLKLKGKGKDAKYSGGIKGGIETTKEGRGKAVTEPNWDNPFDMNYEQDVREWVRPKTIIGLKESSAKALVKELKDAKGGNWLSNDNEEVVGSVFQKKLRDKVQVAVLSRVFWNEYQKDMWEFLDSFLSDDEMEGYVHKPVRKLPNYRIA